MTDAETRVIEQALTEVRVVVASGFAAINARLDAQKDHEPRIRALENRHQLTREDVRTMLDEAIASSRRPAWRDVGALIAAISTSVLLVLAVLSAVVGG
jgi:hypothetical protein